MILEFPDSHAINLLEVQQVGPVGGDPSWLRYSVYFKDGKSIEVYEKRAHVEGKPTRMMKRADFMTKWKSALNPSDPDWALKECQKYGTDF
jgi:hypothetical protein